MRPPENTKEESLSNAFLKIEHLHVSFDGFKALNGVNLEVGPGELRVLIGPNGAGKSTTLDIICGKTRATSGRIMFKGSEITRWNEAAIARTGIGRKFQNPTIFRTLTVRQNLEVARRRSFKVSNNLLLRTPAQIDRDVGRVLELLELEDHADAPAGELSHGQTQWLDLGMLLVQNPDLLLLDEPTAGMTAAETAKTSRILRSLKGSHTLIVVEHDMAFVREICEIITVMDMGEVLAEGTAKEIQSNPKVVEAYLGSSGVA